MSALSHAFVAPFAAPKARARYESRCLRQKCGGRGSASYVFMSAWKQMGRSEVHLPDDVNKTKAIVHFLPGAFVSTQPSRCYELLLEEFRKANFLVVATPFQTSLNHFALSRDVVDKYLETQRELMPLLPSRWLPTIGVGHSLGSKLHMLINSSRDFRLALPPRAANVHISYNNFDARSSLKIDVNMLKNLNYLDTLGPMLGFNFRLSDFGVNVKDMLVDLDRFGGEFDPTPAQADWLLRNEYGVSDNLVVSFQGDQIDHSDGLEEVLARRFGNKSTMRRVLAGSHVTPNTPDFATASSRLDLSFFGDVVNNLYQNTVRAFRPTLESQATNLTNTIVAYILFRCESIESRLLKSSTPGPDLNEFK